MTRHIAIGAASFALTAMLIVVSGTQGMGLIA
jgi:DNA integrity scanning protein DisA with diadenylate cyclase activity